MSRILSFLGIRQGDGLALAPALMFAFLGVGAMSLSSIAVDTLFVSAFNLGDISRFYIIMAAVRFGAALGYALVVRTFEGPRLDGAILGLTAVCLLSTGFFVPRASGASLYWICVLLLVLPPLLPLMVFRSVLGAFETRQAKRLLPLVAAAATSGVIVTNAAASLVAKAVGSTGILYGAGILALLAIPWPRQLFLRAQALGPSDSGDTRAFGVMEALMDSRRELRATPVALIVLGSTLLMATAESVVDYAFKAALKMRFKRDEIAYFLGIFGAGANLVVLLTQLLGTTRFVVRFGVRAALATPFLILMVFSPGLGLVGGLVWAAAARLSQTTFHYALSAPVVDLLLAPIPSRTQLRTKVLTKGLATPVGTLLAGIILASFGQGGVPFWAIGIIMAITGIVGIVSILRTRRAYTDALASALGEGFEAPPDSAAALRREVCRVLTTHVAKGDVHNAKRMLNLFNHRFFKLIDVAPALRSSHPAIRQAAIVAALRAAGLDRGTRTEERASQTENLGTKDEGEPASRPSRTSVTSTEEQGELLLSLAPPDADVETEYQILKAARRLGATPDRARIDRALTLQPGHSDLWAESLVALAKTDRESAVRQLRQEALIPGSVKRVAALRAIADLGDKSARKEVLLSLGSTDPAVFSEAARAAVLLEAPGTVAVLLGHLSAGFQVRAVTRALALGGAAVIDDLIAGLPTTHGQVAGLPTSLASGRALTGGSRIARVLARLGPEACSRVLERFAELGYRARNAVARSLACIPADTGTDIDPELVLAAMDRMLSYAEALMKVYPSIRKGLLRREVRHRIDGTAMRLLDLASLIADRDRVLLARAALPRRGKARDRGNALELLENILPFPIASRAVWLLEFNLDARSPPSSSKEPPHFDGWLDKCRAFDDNELDPQNPMSSVLERVLTLVDSSLFTGLSGEELYPVAEIAQEVGVTAGETVIQQGTPGDALFVVAQGSFNVVRNGLFVRKLGPGDVFGEMALLDGEPRAATVIALTFGRVLRIPRAEFDALLDESPELSRGVIRTLLGHIRASTA